MTVNSVVSRQMSAPQPPQVGLGVVSTGSQEQLAAKHPNHKTKMCQRWLQGGCSYGSKCGSDASDGSDGSDDDDAVADSGDDDAVAAVDATAHTPI